MRYILLLLLLLATVLAHGVGNQVEQTVQGVLFEYGRETATPIAGESTTLSFSLRNASTHEPLAGNVWLRISDDTGVVFSSTDIVHEKNPLLMTYTFPSSGRYIIQVEVHDASATFTTDVSSSFDYANLLIVAAAAIAMLIGYRLKG